MGLSIFFESYTTHSYCIQITLEILETVNKMQIYKDDDADWCIVTGFFLNIELTKEKKLLNF